MQTEELVSVIINCRNSEKFLKESINSVVNQTFKNLEIIIVDNHSTDNTKNIIDSYKDKRIKYFYTKSYLSLGAARNVALEKSNGKFMHLLTLMISGKNKILNTIRKI